MSMKLGCKSLERFIEVGVGEYLFPSIAFRIAISLALIINDCVGNIESNFQTYN